MCFPGFVFQIYVVNTRIIFFCYVNNKSGAVRVIFSSYPAAALHNGLGRKETQCGMTCANNKGASSAWALKLEMVLMPEMHVPSFILDQL